jgi:hypothetical protein
MNRTFLYLICIIALSSCNSSLFLQEVEGTWKITEVNYIYDSSTYTYYPTDQFFVFDDGSFHHEQNGTIDESGTFDVNLKATLITFHSALGNSKYTILEKSETHQHWKSKTKLIDFYLDFKLEKVQ